MPKEGGFETRPYKNYRRSATRYRGLLPLLYPLVALMSYKRSHFPPDCGGNRIPWGPERNQPNRGVLCRAFIS
jgi:hypothetical protein